MCLYGWYAAAVTIVSLTARVNLLGEPGAVCLQYIAWRPVSSSTGLYAACLTAPDSLPGEVIAGSAGATGSAVVLWMLQTMWARTPTITPALAAAELAWSVFVESWTIGVLTICRWFLRRPWTDTALTLVSCVVSLFSHPRC